MSSEFHPFRSAAQHYLKGRPPYASALIQRVAEVCRLGGAQRVLDLGCGPGQLALAFAPFAGEVIGVDPEPEMLRIARAEAARAGRPMEFREGSSREVGPDLGTFRLVTIGRAFHWMDRRDTLRRLDQIIEREGSVVLFDDEMPRVPDNRWLSAFDELVERFAEGDPNRAVWKSADWLRHEAVLLDSPFPSLERISVIDRRQTPLDCFVDRALSISSLSRDRLGPRADELAHALREAMSAYAKGETVTEVVESIALIAKRASAGSARFDAKEL